MRIRKNCFCAILVTVGIMPVAVMAATADVPEWTYAVMEEMVAKRYVVPPAGTVRTLSRQQMAVLTASVLENMEAVDQSEALNNLVRSYGVVSRLAVQDEAEYQTLKKQSIDMESAYTRILAKIKENSRKQVYGDLQGSPIDVLDRLQAEERKNEESLEHVVTQWTFLKRRTEQRKIELDAIIMKKKELQEKILESGNNGMTVPLDMRQEAAKLRAEFSPELNNIGYFDIQKGSDIAVLSSPKHPVSMDKRLKIDGEVRLDSRSNDNQHTIDQQTKKNKYPDNLLRLRERLYMDYNINDNWHLLGMLESEKALRGSYDDMDGNINLDRYYLQGYAGNILVSAGAFGTTMAEGNIYDSKFKGIMAAYGDGKPWSYRLQYGRIDLAKKVATASMSYDTDNYGLDVGVYHFDIDGGRNRNVFMANIRRPIGGWLTLGGMYLHGQDESVGNGDGVVVTLARGKENSWQKGNIYAYLKYYHQPASTYVEHTMNGTADWMSGFKGPGIGFSYTLHKNMVFSMEYDRLRDLKTGDHANTIWGGFSYYFNNYEND